MVLSNAERQRRHRQRLRERADQGIAPSDVLQAMRVLWEDIAEKEPALGSWDLFVSRCKGQRGLAIWQETCLDLGRLDPDEDLSEYGDAADVVRRVAKVMRVVVNGPPEDS